MPMIRRVLLVAPFAWSMAFAGLGEPGSASPPPESETMAEAVVATRAEAMRLMEVFAASGLQATSAEMHIAACEDRARMHHPNALVWFEDPYGRPVERADVDTVVAALVGDGWSLTQSERFDEGVDAANPVGYTVSARRGEQRIIFRVLADGARGWFDLLGACLDNSVDQRELYEAIGRWALPVPAGSGATQSPATTAIP